MLSNKIDKRTKLLPVRNYEIHKENPWLFEPQRNWDCSWPKREISGSPIYPFVHNKIPKNYSDINPTWYLYVRTGTNVGTFEFNPKRSNMHIWFPGFRLRSFKVCMTSLWNVWRHTFNLFAHCAIPVPIWHLPTTTPKISMVHILASWACFRSLKDGNSVPVWHLSWHHIS